MAKQLKEIEKALYDVYKDIKLTSLLDNDNTLTDVNVFVAYPENELQLDTVYPAISINLSEMEIDFKMEHTLPRTDIEVDYTTTPPTYRTRETSHWYRLRYLIETYALTPQEDRELIRKVENRLNIRDSLIVGDEDYWIFRLSFSTQDIDDTDRIIYHKIFTYEVLADIDNEDTDRIEKGVTEMQYRFNQFKTIPTKDQGIKPANENNEIVKPIDATRYYDRTMAFNETQIWFPSN